MRAEMTTCPPVGNLTKHGWHPLHQTTLIDWSFAVPRGLASLFSWAASLLDMDPVEEGSRAAGGRLADRHGQQLTLDVDAALGRRNDPQHRFVDPISLGGLIVSVATLAWTVYRDLKKDRGDKPSARTVTTAVRRQLEWEGDVDINEHASLIETTVETTIEAAERQEA